MTDAERCFHERWIEQLARAFVWVAERPRGYARESRDLALSCYLAGIEDHGARLRDEVETG